MEITEDDLFALADSFGGTYLNPAECRDIKLEHTAANLKYEKWAADSLKIVKSLSYATTDKRLNRDKITDLITSIENQFENLPDIPELNYALDYSADAFETKAEKISRQYHTHMKRQNETATLLS